MNVRAVGAVTLASAVTALVSLWLAAGAEHAQPNYRTESVEGDPTALARLQESAQREESHIERELRELIVADVSVKDGSMKHVALELGDSAGVNVAVAVDPVWAERYRGMSADQLLDEGRLLNVAYTQLAREAFSLYRNDKARREPVPDEANESGWEGLIYSTNYLPGIGTAPVEKFRIRLRPEEWPEIYALRAETEWLFAESERRRELGWK